MIEWILPLEIQSPNIKEHWSKTYARNNRNKRILRYQWQLLDEKPNPPCSISIQRLYTPSLKGKRWDDDNMITGMKGIRDILADLLIPGKAPGQADNIEHGIKFEYDQLTARKKGVRIIIMTQEEIEDAAQDLFEEKKTLNLKK